MPTPIVLHPRSLHLPSPQIAKRMGQIIAQRNHRRKYTTKDIERDLEPVRRAWRRYRKSYDKMAVHGFLQAVYTLVLEWKHIKRSRAMAGRLLQIQEAPSYMVAEPFSLVIHAANRHIDPRSRSKWSRSLRFAAREKVRARKLGRFIRRRGGVNACARLLKSRRV
jgi:hypothetical protein